MSTLLRRVLATSSRVSVRFFLLGAFLILLYPALSRAGFFYGKQKFYTVKTEHFTIHFPEGLGHAAEEIRGISEEAYERMTTRLKWQPWGRTHIVLTDKTDVPNGLATVMPTNSILLYIATPSADSTLDHYHDYLRMLFNHEFTHIVHIDMHSRWASAGRFFLGQVVAPNGATPAWMREGMAVYEESQLDPQFGRIHSAHTDMVLRTSYYENKFPRLDQIAGLSHRFPAGTGPYLFGSKFFDWLAQKYGEDRMYQYQKEYSSSLWTFALNNKARRVYSKSFYKLWDEFRADLTQTYEQQREVLNQSGLTLLSDVINTKDTQSYYTLSPEVGGYAYYESGLDDEPKIVVRKNAQSEELIIKRRLFGQMSFSKTGRYLAFSSLSSVEPKTAYADVYYYDLEKKKLYRVYDAEHAKKSMRAMDPDFSSQDGGQRWIVMTRNFLGNDQLAVSDAYEKKNYVITQAPAKTQFSNPRFSPDGSKIVVSRKDPSGYRDIVIYSRLGQELTRVTEDAVADNYPIFSPDGGKIYFTSFRTGIANIFSYDLSRQSLSQVTQVLTGVFQPSVSADGRDIYVQTYSSDKSNIQKFSVGRSGINRVAQLTNDREMDLVGMGFHAHQVLKNKTNDARNDVTSTMTDFVSDTGAHRGAAVQVFSRDPSLFEYLPMSSGGDSDRQESEDDTDEEKITVAEVQSQSDKKDYPSEYKKLLSRQPSEYPVDLSLPPDAKKYHALPQILVPRYVLPSFVALENTVLAGVAIGRSDPLYRHAWTAFANYRSDAQFVGAGATYIYSRYNPIFYVGGLRYAVDWGDINIVDAAGTIIGTSPFFEERRQGYVGAAFNIKKNKFNLSYFYEDRSSFTNLAVNLLNMKPYAGFRFQYSLANFDKFPNSISQENGYFIKVNSEWTNTIFLSNDVNEERTLYGDFRYYFEMPWSDHHVLALRVMGGWVWGDRQEFGVYRLGGPFGEGVGTSPVSRLFPLRGLAGITFSGDRAFLFSAEYRLPLMQNANRGLGTWPVFMDKLYLALFCDGGDIKSRTALPDLFTRMLVSVGAELKGDFILGYGLPITGRLGYGVVLTNRDRLGTLTDTITGASLKNGSIYFQAGTMF